MTVPCVLLATCRACSKGRDPREFAGGPIIGICWQCYERHVEGLAVLAGNPPQGCQECGLTLKKIDELSRVGGLPDTRLVLERKDGIYQILCLPCDRIYRMKRADLYKHTPFGAAIGL